MSTGFTVGDRLDTLGEAREFVLTEVSAGLAADRGVLAHNHFATGDQRLEGWPHVLYTAVADGSGAVSARVNLWGIYSGELIIKTLHETEGPGQYEGVSQEVLAALTPTDHHDAQAWRAHAARWSQLGTSAQARRDQAVGKIIALAEPVTHHELGPVTVVRVVSPNLFRVARPETDGTATYGQTLAAPHGWEMSDFSVLTGTALAAMALAAAAPRRAIEPARSTGRAPIVTCPDDVIDLLAPALTNSDINLALLHAAGDLWSLHGDTAGQFTADQHAALERVVAAQQRLLAAESAAQSAAIAAASLTVSHGEPGTGIETTESAPAPGAAAADIAGVEPG